MLLIYLSSLQCNTRENSVSLLSHISFFPLTHIFLLFIRLEAHGPFYWDSQKKWYCRIIPTPPGLSQSIIQHCQPMARFVYVMIYWIQLLLLFSSPLTNLLSSWQMAWQSPVWQRADIQVGNVSLRSVYLHQTQSQTEL